MAENQFFQVRYEDLLNEPLKLMESIYDQLELPDFDAARPHVRAYVDQRKDYKPNTHPQLRDDVQEAIAERWGDYAKMYGYDL